MKFCEAMELLKNGSKVTRVPWIDGVHFVMKDGMVKAFQPNLSHYLYDQSIMVSDGWIIIGEEGEHNFCEIIPFLMKGKWAKMKQWDSAHIYFDFQNKKIIIRTMQEFTYLPEPESFLAEDWIEIEPPKYRGEFKVNNVN